MEKRPPPGTLPPSQPILLPELPSHPTMIQKTSDRHCVLATELAHGAETGLSASLQCVLHLLQFRHLDRPNTEGPRAVILGAKNPWTTSALSLGPDLVYHIATLNLLKERTLPSTTTYPERYPQPSCGIGPFRACVQAAKRKSRWCLILAVRRQVAHRQRGRHRIMQRRRRRHALRT